MKAWLSNSRARRLGLVVGMAALPLLIVGAISVPVRKFRLELVPPPNVEAVRRDCTERYSSPPDPSSPEADIWELLRSGQSENCIRSQYERRSIRRPMRPVLREWATKVRDALDEPTYWYEQAIFWGARGIAFALILLLLFDAVLMRAARYVLGNRDAESSR